jgi:hypothetical protein
MHELRLQVSTLRNERTAPNRCAHTRLHITRPVSVFVFRQSHFSFRVVVPFCCVCSALAARGGAKCGSSIDRGEELATLILDAVPLAGQQLIAGSSGH